MKEDRDIVLFRIDRKVGLLLLGALAVVFGGFALAQQLTLTTSYPVPSGIYNQLITTGNSGVVPADTTFNRNAGNTILVPPTNATGGVGIGTASPSPNAKLDVAGVIGVGTFGADPAGNDGQIYYNNGATPGFKGHIKGAWGPLAGAGGAVAAQTAIHAVGGCSPAFTFTPPSAGKYVILASASVYAWKNRCSTVVRITQGACNGAVISNSVEGYRDTNDPDGFYFPATVIGVANLPTTTPFKFYVSLTNGGAGGTCANQFSPAAYSSVGWAAFPSL